MAFYRRIMYFDVLKYTLLQMVMQTMKYNEVIQQDVISIHILKCMDLHDNLFEEQTYITTRSHICIIYDCNYTITCVTVFA